MIFIIIVMLIIGMITFTNMPNETQLNNDVSIINSKVDEYKDIIGGWESSASEGGSYYVFNEDNTYYWYKSSDDLTDNYYKGNMEILKGADAVSELGITEEQVATVFKNSKYKITIDDIYCIKLKPTYLISGGVNKTDTLTDNFNMKMLFVYVDENNAQAHNYTTGDTYYFVKK